MRMARLPVVALAGVALAAPLACLAAPASLAARNCAQALANRMNTRLAWVNEQPNFGTPLGPSTSSSPYHEQYVLTAHTRNGERQRVMLCTVDRYGQVVSLQRPAPVETLPLLGTASAQ